MRRSPNVSLRYIHLKVRLLGLITWANVGLGLVARVINTWCVLRDAALLSASPMALSSCWNRLLCGSCSHSAQVYEPHFGLSAYRIYIALLCCWCNRSCCQSHAAVAPAARLYRASAFWLHRTRSCGAGLPGIDCCSGRRIITGANQQIFSIFRVATCAARVSRCCCRAKAFFSATCACSHLRQERPCSLHQPSSLRSANLCIIRPQHDVLSGSWGLVEWHRHERCFGRCSLLRLKPSWSVEQRHFLHTGSVHTRSLLALSSISTHVCPNRLSPPRCS
jgi:hypothetical protein